MTTASMDFSDALRLMRQGRRMYRHDWVVNKPRAQHVWMLGDKLILVIHKTRGRAAAEWTPEQKDLLANDWKVHE